MMLKQQKQKVIYHMAYNVKVIHLLQAVFYTTKCVARFLCRSIASYQNGARR